MAAAPNTQGNSAIPNFGKKGLGETTLSYQQMTSEGNPHPLPPQPRTVEQSTVAKPIGKELQDWKDTIHKELGSMAATLRLATQAEKDELRRLSVQPTPSRMVFAQKPNRKKARLVVCGQFLDQYGDSNTSNLGASPLRTLLDSGWRKATP